VLSGGNNKGGYMAYSKSDPMATVLSVIRTNLEIAERAHRNSMKKKNRYNEPEWEKNKVKSKLQTIRHISENVTMVRFQGLPL
jgi:hypothetical protein